MNHPHAPDRTRTGLALVLTPLIVLITVAIFAWPAARAEPRDLPMGIVGPDPAIAGMQEALPTHGFAPSTYDDEAAARAAIEDREIYGAIIVNPDGNRVLLASAASPVVARILRQATTGFAVQSNQPPPVFEDVVPAPAGDPQGAVLTASMLPLVLSGIVGGVILSRLTTPGWMQTGAFMTAAVLNGAVAGWVIQTWLGALEGSWWANAGVFMLMQLAIIGAVTGAHALWGLPGLGIAAATMMLLGNPWSGIMSAPELLPEWVATIGQLLPPGATGTLIRSTAFFDGAASGQAVVVLLTWIALGLGALAFATWRQREMIPAASFATR